MSSKIQLDMNNAKDGFVQLVSTRRKKALQLVAWSKIQSKMSKFNKGFVRLFFALHNKGLQLVIRSKSHCKSINLISGLSDNTAYLRIKIDSC
jgi:hypothetical protein